MPSPEARLPSGEEIFALVRRQVSLGPRFPGSSGHKALQERIARLLEKEADEMSVQEFDVPLPGGSVRCANLIGLFCGRAQDSAPTLLGTHFDTRLAADREQDPRLRRLPIPGANDGGSGTAILLCLLPRLREAADTGALPRSSLVAFFDAEDVGDIATLPFSMGARRFVQEPVVPLPREALILDMVGGAGLELDVDAHVFSHPPSLNLTRKVFRIGRECDPQVFRGGKLKYILCDHTPFREAGIPACLLIDLDYPEWHTHADLPRAMSARSLATVAEVALRFLLTPAAPAPHGSAGGAGP